MARLPKQRKRNNSSLRAIRVRDLRNQIGIPSYEPRPFLRCRRCGGEYSANAGDYFMEHPDLVLTCCDQPLSLVTRTVVYTEVRANG